MRKMSIFITAILLISLLTACSKNNSAELEKQVSSLQKQVAALTSELSSVKADKEKVQAAKDVIQTQLDDSVKATKVQTDDVTVTVINKINHAKNTDNWQFSDRVSLEVSIKNNTTKDIKGIQGNMDVQDLFGVSILSVNCDFVGKTVKPKESYINKDLGMDINEFMDDHVKLFTTAFKDLKFVYKTTKIVFTDGTVKE